ncbi:MAG: carboxypeptidase-like regulatory domain-containing protein, partial [Prevotella sp.]|nr:carboxypeptidase-like regulatory domain-containing protein [Prevotella sp.]
MKKFLIMLLSCLFVTATHAQRITQNFRNVSLAEALTTISKHSKTYKVNFIFNELEDFTVTTSVQKKDVLDAIRQVIGFYPMRLTIDGDNIFIECTQKEKSKLTGVVVDSIGKPVIYANISLLSERDSSFITGGVSNESGRFVIPCERKKVIVRISSVGYKPYVRTANVGDMGRVMMTPDAIMIQGVTVKSDRPMTRLTPEGYTTQVLGTLLSDLGTAADVLKQIPRVSGDGGTFTVFGKGAPIIYINGKKVNDSNELQRLSSTEIKSVDVITSPGARYSAE